MKEINFDNISDESVYEIFGVDGKEAEALSDTYLELFELIGRDALLKLYTHFRGNKIDCPMRLYRPEFIADLAKNAADRRERAKIARAGGYPARVIERLLSKRRQENEKRSSNAGDTPLPYSMGMLRHQARLARTTGNKVRLAVEMHITVFKEGHDDVLPPMWSANS